MPIGQDHNYEAKLSKDRALNSEKRSTDESVVLQKACGRQLVSKIQAT